MANYKKMTERRQKEDEATAFAFQEFIDTFQNATPTAKTFIKSGVYNAGRGEETDDDKGKLYTPLSLMKLQTQDTTKRAMECARLVKENKFDRTKHSIKPKSNLELLKEEFSLRHVDRDVRHKQKKPVEVDTSGDSIDATTNLYLTNLNPKLDEQDLMQIFGVYGPLASVKIMWPRPEDRVRNSNIGFVAYMSRKDSERAYANIGNREDMRVSWGKPVEIPVQPVYIPPELVKAMLPPPYSGLPFNAQPLQKSYKMPQTDEEMGKLLHNAVVKVTIPMDKKLLMVIHRVIEFVIREGPMFEAMIMNKEIANPTFKFLFDNKSPVHVYYRWKLFSLLNGDGHMSWSMKPFRMFKGGSVWIPPTLPDYTKGMVDNKSDDKKSNLSDNQQFRLIQILQNLNLSRKSVADATVFCLTHAEAAKDIVNIINESFENPSTHAPKKIARLYLVSDILYNTMFKRAPLGLFHDLFEHRLQGIFENLEGCYKTLIQMVDKNAFRSRALKVIRVWEMWKVYNSDFLDKLESTLLGEICDDSDNDEPLDGKALINRSLAYNPACVVQPPETKFIKAEPMVEKEEDVYANFIKSQWETLDPDEIESQAMSSKKLHDIERARIESERREKEKSSEHEKLKEVDFKVLKYQNDLKTGRRRLKKNCSIEEGVSEYRKKCLEQSKREAKAHVSDLTSSDELSSGEKRDSRKKHKKKKYTRNKKYRR